MNWRAKELQGNKRKQAGMEVCNLEGVVDGSTYEFSFRGRSGPV